MAPYARWVHDSFKQLLLDSCDEYLKTNDRSTNKACSAFITQVSKDIVDITQGKNVILPDDLEKVITISHL